MKEGRRNQNFTGVLKFPPPYLPILSYLALTASILLDIFNQLQDPKKSTKMMRAFDKCMENRYCRTTMNILRWVPVVFVTATMVWAYYAFVYQYCMGKSSQVRESLPLHLTCSVFVMIEVHAQRIAYMVVFHVLLALFLWSYIQVVFTRVACPPSKVGLP